MCHFRQGQGKSEIGAQTNAELLGLTHDPVGNTAKQVEREAAHEIFLVQKIGGENRNIDSFDAHHTAHVEIYLGVQQTLGRHPIFTGIKDRSNGWASENLFANMEVIDLRTDPHIVRQICIVARVDGELPFRVFDRLIAAIQELSWSIAPERNPRDTLA